MPATPDFNAARAERQQATIELPLGLNEDGTTRVWQLRRAVPADVLFDAAQALVTVKDDAAPTEAEQAEAMLVTRDFLLGLASDADRAEFEVELLHRTDLQTVGEIMAWVIAEATGRPLEQPSPSE
jgi:hypothetical protein